MNSKADHTLRWCCSGGLSLSDSLGVGGHGLGVFLTFMAKDFVELG